MLPWFRQWICMVLVGLLEAALSRHRPGSVRTVRDLVPFAQTSRDIPWTRKKVTLTGKKLVMEQMAPKEAKHSEDATWGKFGI